MEKTVYRYFKLVEPKAQDTPCLQYFRFSDDGRMLNCISYYSPVSEASDRLPKIQEVNASYLYGNLSIALEPLDEFEEEWDGGYTIEISRDEFDQALEVATESE
ncbi:hypothetical protein [Ruegeria arenilitoris]|uniref:hypothetical protein n=1 Tax=Ruegeria arenilitoris TaxID=1173585 RepID=UPI00147F3687|nr:hypothetical protein [Ruegeria arenilitoris]